MERHESCLQKVAHLNQLDDYNLSTNRLMSNLKIILLEISISYYVVVPRICNSYYVVVPRICNSYYVVVPRIYNSYYVVVPRICNSVNSADYY